MKSVILGTAGHVDHGKTALVEALTGINTDRWEEERQRGITIDLGFAPFPPGPDDLEISVVDVPGHEDFVKNMLAGATGMDLLLLVVAADEGPMPQTREHLWIARLLGVAHGVVAISKCDLVDTEWQELVTESVGEELGRIFSGDRWPAHQVSTVTAEGIDELRSSVYAAARQVEARHQDDLFRLPVDRSFSVRGVGTVVTGTVWGGRIEAGAEVRIMPRDRRVRLRGIQVHGREAQAARAGQRAALALTGVDRSEIGRGDLITTDPVWRSSRCLEAELFLLPDCPRPLKHWQRVRFHLGTAETMARVVLHGGQALPPGERGPVQLRLERPVVARARDRFVLRFYSPVTTIGGGVILDPWAERRPRGPAGRLESLASPDLPGRLLKLAEERREGISEAELSVLLGERPAQVQAAVQELGSAGGVRELNGRWFGQAVFEAARVALLEAIAEGHARDEGARGVSLESLRSGAGWPADLINAVLADLRDEQLIRVDGSLAALADHVPRLTARQKQLESELRKRLHDEELSPPTVKELSLELGVKNEVLLPVLKFLAEAGELVAVTPDIYFDVRAVEEVKRRVRLALEGGRVATPSELRKALAVSRKYLIPLLEHLDALGLTRRTGVGRVLRTVDGAGR